MIVSAFIATSVDGYIARLNHDIDWLHSSESVENEDYGYDAFMSSVTVVVMGRKTFQKILTFDQWPYTKQRIIVLSNTLKENISHITEEVEFFDGSVNDLIDLLALEGEHHVYVDGSIAIQSFIAENLLNEITITTIPILLGEGIPLFGGGFFEDVKLDHIETKAFANGFVQTNYRF